MNRLGSLVAGLALVALVSGCPSGKDTPKSGDTPPKADKTPDKAGKGDKAQTGGAKTPLDAPTDATAVISVAYDGTPPKAAVLPGIETHADKAICKHGEEFEQRDQTWIVGDKGEVRNVVITFEAPAGKVFQKKEVAGEVVLDQPHCVFIPHILAVRPGQKLVVKNSSEVSHNSNIKGEDNTFNRTLQPKTSVTVNLVPEREPLQVTCQIHGWMQAKIYVPSHPYIGVTNEKGEITIPDLPSGVELKMVIQHEGLKEKITKTVKLEKGENKLSEKIKAQ